MRALVLALVAAGCGPSLGPGEVPITIHQSSSQGSMRYSVPIAIGGHSLDVFFDTGSSGLRLLPGAIPDDALAPTGEAVSYSYHSGLEIDGVLANATVEIGGFSTPSPIPIMLVQQVGCTAAKPTCDAAGKSAADYRFFGGFQAVFGVGMRSRATDHGIASPIAQLDGAPAFIVRSPTYGGDSGVLELAPATSERARFVTYQLDGLSAAAGGAPLPNGTPSWNDRGIPTCVDDLESGVDYCVPAELDSGNPPTYIEWPAQASPAVLPSGDSIQVKIGPPGAVLEEYDFTVGDAPRPGVDLIDVESATGAPFMNLGTAVFFRYDVLFDPQTGVEGFAPHPSGDP